MGDNSNWQNIWTIAQPVAAAAAAFIAVWLRDRFNSMKNRIEMRHVPLRELSESNRRIDTLLIEVRAKLNARSVYLTRFRNGDHFIDGAEVLRITRTNEVVGPGIASAIDRYESILVSRIDDEMDLVRGKGPCFTCVDSLGPNSLLRRMCEVDGAGCIARCAVWRQGEIVAFVGADFSHGDKPPENIDILTEYARRIEQMLA